LKQSVEDGNALTSNNAEFAVCYKYVVYKYDGRSFHHRSIYHKNCYIHL